MSNQTKYPIEVDNGATISRLNCVNKRCRSTALVMSDSKPHLDSSKTKIVGREFQLHCNQCGTNQLAVVKEDTDGDWQGIHIFVTDVDKQDR